MSVDIVLLAAGRSSRMGGPHKLLATFAGMPLVRRSAEAGLASRAARVIVVLGHRGPEMAAALAGLPIERIDNPEHAQGLSTSLRAGFAASRADGALVMLADQPFLTSAHLDRLIEAFVPAGQGSIVVAADGGRRFNPVILSTFYRDAVDALTGDVGAKSILAAHPDLVVEIDIGRAASVDVDTPEAMRAAGGVLGP